MAKQPDAALQLSQYWPYKAAVLGDLVGRHTSQVLKRHGSLNLSQWRVLAAVGEAPGRSANEVVAITPMDKGIVSRAVKTLIAQGLLARVVDGQDRRRASLRLTNQGAALYNVIAADLQACVAPIASKISDIAAFIDMTDAAIDAYQAALAAQVEG